MPDLRNNTRRGRFEMDVDGRTAATYYKKAPGVIVLTHTEVPKELEGRGLGSQLARGALDWARAQGLKVEPRCPFIKAYIGRHQEYADLVKL